LRYYDSKQSLKQNIHFVANRLFDRTVFLHHSAKLDYRYAVVNHLFTVSILIYMFASVNILSGFFYGVFSYISFLQGVGINIGWMGSIVVVLMYAFAYDTSNFFQHMLQHKIPILWEFHKVHHSAEVLTPVTAVRVHPMGQAMAATVGAIVYGSMNGLAYILFTGKVAEYSLLGANFFALLYFTFGLYHLKHTHIWFTYPKVIKEILASPSLHLIHHSNDPIHYDKNFGFVFTFWDRIFSTYYDPREDEQYGLTLGISKSEGRDDYCSVKQLYLTPFIRAWHYHIKPKFGSDYSKSSIESKDTSLSEFSNSD